MLGKAHAFCAACHMTFAIAGALIQMPLWFLLIQGGMVCINVRGAIRAAA